MEHKGTPKATMFFNLALVLSLLLLMISSAEFARLVNDKEAAAKGPTLTCSQIHGVEEGETCFSMQKKFGLSEEGFSSFNPNINCDDLFVGQWICLNASQEFN